MPEQLSKVEVWFDGALDCIAQRAGYGFAVARDGRVIFTCAGYVGDGPEVDSQSAEYAALLEAMRYLRENNITQATVHGDADTVIKSVTGECGISRRYRDQVLELISLAAQMPEVDLVWIPRGSNNLANTLASSALLNHAAPAALHVTENTPTEPKPARRLPRLRRKLRQLLSRIIFLLS
jgi:ribonuclease HI